MSKRCFVDDLVLLESNGKDRRVDLQLVSPTNDFGLVPGFHWEFLEYRRRKQICRGKRIGSNFNQFFPVPSSEGNYDVMIAVANGMCPFMGSGESLPVNVFGIVHENARSGVRMSKSQPGYVGVIEPPTEYMKAWAKDTYVEFDDGLNHAIRRLRGALHDTAQVPQFIETIPRRGYRFIARVDIESPASPVRLGEKTGPPRSRLHRGLLAVAAFAALGIFSIALVHRRSTRHIESLAVLPLANFSGDSQQEFFADGLTEEVTTELARINSVRVISRTSAMRLKGARLSLAQIGRELGVDAVVEGSGAEFWRTRPDFRPTGPHRK